MDGCTRVIIQPVQWFEALAMARRRGKPVEEQAEEPMSQRDAGEARGKSVEFCWKLVAPREPPRQVLLIARHESRSAKID